MRANEHPEDAALREAREETNLSGLTVERYLGVGEYDLRPYANAIQARHYYQLSFTGSASERWLVYERGDADNKPIRFELYWLPLRQA